MIITREHFIAFAGSEAKAETESKRLIAFLKLALLFQKQMQINLRAQADPKGGIDVQSMIEKYNKSLEEWREGDKTFPPKARGFTFNPNPAIRALIGWVSAGYDARIPSTYSVSPEQITGWSDCKSRGTKGERISILQSLYTKVTATPKFEAGDKIPHASAKRMAKCVHRIIETNDIGEMLVHAARLRLSDYKMWAAMPYAKEIREAVLKEGIAEQAEKITNLVCGMSRDVRMCVGIISSRMLKRAFSLSDVSPDFAVDAIVKYGIEYDPDKGTFASTFSSYTSPISKTVNVYKDGKTSTVSKASIIKRYLERKHAIEDYLNPYLKAVSISQDAFGTSAYWRASNWTIEPKKTAPEQIKKEVVADKFTVEVITL